VGPAGEAEAGPRSVSDSSGGTTSAPGGAGGGGCSSGVAGAAGAAGAPGAAGAGAGALAMAASAGSDVEAHANSTTVALAWLRTIPGVPLGDDGSKQVAASLPHVGKWAATGFITVGPIFPGAPERYVPLQHPVIQFDFWAVHANSKKPNFSVANNLAEIVRAAAETNMWSDPPELELPPGVSPVWISGIDVIRGIVHVPDPSYAHFTLDVHIGWIERDALAGVIG